LRQLNLGYLKTSDLTGATYMKEETQV